MKNFLLGTILSGTASVSFILLIFNNLKDPTKISWILFYILCIIIALIIFILIIKNKIWEKLLGYKPDSFITNINDIQESIESNNYKNIFKPSKELFLKYIASKGRIQLLYFIILLFSVIAGFSSMGILYKELNLLTNQNREFRKQYNIENNFTKTSINLILKKQKEESEKYYREIKFDLLKKLYDKDTKTGNPIYNSKIRETALLYYLELEYPRKKHNLYNAINNKTKQYSYANSSNQINLSYALLNNISFTRHNLSSINFAHANFKKADLYNTDFNNSDLSYANFENSILTESNLSNTNLIYTNFIHAKMSNVSISLNQFNIVINCNIYGAEISKKTKKYLLEKGCVEEQNITKWELEKKSFFNLKR